MKSKKSLKKVVKYLRELSIIVVGIAITVGIGILVNSNNNRKDQKQYLDAIKLELEENAKMFDFAAKWLQKPVRYADYILSNDKNSLNKDTLDYYEYTDDEGCGIMFVASLTARFSTNAFEMFKISGAMRQIKNKELLQSIWSTYSQIELAKQNIDRCFRIKEEEVAKLLLLTVEGKTIDVPMLNFHVSGYPYEMVRYCRQTSEVIKEMLSKFE